MPESPLKPLGKYTPMELWAGLCVTEPTKSGDLYTQCGALWRCTLFHEGGVWSMELLGNAELIRALVLSNRCYRDALKQITDPIAAFSARLEPGEVLNGLGAVRLSNDPNYLKGIARDALERAQEQDKEANHG